MNFYSPLMCNSSQLLDVLLFFPKCNCREQIYIELILQKMFVSKTEKYSSKFRGFGQQQTGAVNERMNPKEGKK